MELEQLIQLAKNLYDHFHLKGKIALTQDEYRLCESLLSHNVDIRGLFTGLSIINNDVLFFGSISISKRGING